MCLHRTQKNIKIKNKFISLYSNDQFYSMLVAFICDLQPFDDNNLRQLLFHILYILFGLKESQIGSGALSPYIHSIFFDFKALFDDIDETIFKYFMIEFNRQRKLRKLLKEIIGTTKKTMLAFRLNRRLIENQ